MCCYNLVCVKLVVCLKVRVQVGDSWWGRRNDPGCSECTASRSAYQHLILWWISLAVLFWWMGALPCIVPRTTLLFSSWVAVGQSTNTHTHTRLTALFPGLPGWAGTRKVKPIWILLKQETVSSSGISWALCKSASRCRQITMPVLHYSKFFYRPGALPATQPTASKHWRQL